MVGSSGPAKCIGTKHSDKDTHHIIIEGASPIANIALEAVSPLLRHLDPTAPTTATMPTTTLRHRRLLQRPPLAQDDTYAATFLG